MGTESIEKHKGGSDQIEEYRHPLVEILQNIVRVSYKKSKKDFSLTFFIFEFFENIWEGGHIRPPPARNRVKKSPPLILFE